MPLPRETKLRRERRERQKQRSSRVRDEVAVVARAQEVHRGDVRRARCAGNGARLSALLVDLRCIQGTKQREEESP